MRQGAVCVLGGTGFVGGHVTARLVAAGYPVRILTRHQYRHPDLKVLPGVTLEECDPYDARALRRSFSGCETVINLIGILNERHRNGFYRTHVQLPRLLIETSKEMGVQRFLQMSAIGADSSAPSKYLKSKAQGEDFVHTISGPAVAATSFRPSVIFGPEDQFFNRFARLLKQVPCVFPLACPEAQFAPVYVGDVADAMVATIQDPESFGKRIELCGPKEYRLRQLVEYTAREIHVRKRIIGLPDWASRLQAKILGVAPGRPFTLDNYHSLSVPSVCREKGSCPTRIERIVPKYLGGLNPAASLQHKREQFWVHQKTAG
ncbi:MAG TPA: complex I NDUFA9 subunit family protein [Gammaproteobacteria bacterium]|nr:complex I NDUFA9 subunit family protein [Gammaproteobacteria bacterium]